MRMLTVMKVAGINDQDLSFAIKFEFTVTKPWYRWEEGNPYIEMLHHIRIKRDR